MPPTTSNHFPRILVDRANDSIVFYLWCKANSQAITLALGTSRRCLSVPKNMIRTKATLNVRHVQQKLHRNRHRHAHAPKKKLRGARGPGYETKADIIHVASTVVFYYE